MRGKYVVTAPTLCRSILLMGILSLTACGGPTEPSRATGTVFFSDASKRRLLVLELWKLQENATGFEPADQVIELGVGPWDMTFSPDGNVLYVANRLGDNVQMVSIPSGEILGSVGVGFSPISLHPNWEKALLYVGNTGNNTVSILDVSGYANGGSGSVVGPVVVDTIFLSSVGGLMGTADGSILAVAMPKDDAVAIVAVPDHSVRVVPVGDAPQTVVMGPDDRTAYVPNFVSKTVSVIDVGTAQLVEEIRLDERAGGAVDLAVGPDGEHLYVTRWSTGDERGPGVLEKIHLASRTTVAVIEVGVQAYDVKISPDGRFAVVSSFSGTVATVDLESNLAVLTEIGAGVMAGLRFKPDR